MEREKLQAWRDWVRAELESCVSFWLEHGMDKEHGGVGNYSWNSGACYDCHGNGKEH